MRAIVAALLVWAFSAAAQAQTIKSLAFMSGCWATASNDYRECYTAPYAGLMQGASQTVKNGKTVSWEFAVITEKDGAITYAPFYNGKALSVFTLTTVDAVSVVFENPANDFPKKLIYRKNSDGSLTARTEGGSATDIQNQEWVMRPQS